MSPVELGSWTLTPNPPFSLLLKGLWQGPPEGITVRVGPGLGGREGAHLVRSALRAGTAWQGLVSCAGSKETETGEKGGQDSCSPLPTPHPGSREQTVLWSPQGTFVSKTVRAERDSRAHRTPSFYRGENPRLREFQQRAQSHTAWQGREGQEKPTSGCQPMAVFLHGYSRTVTSLRIFPCHGPPSPLYEDIGPQDPTLAVENGTHVALPT